MKRLPAILEQRARVAQMYAEQLQAIPEVVAPPGRVCWFVYVIRLAARDAVCEQLNARGIGCGRYFAPLHRQPLFAPYTDSDLPITDRISETTLALPFFNHLTEDQVAEVCRSLQEALERT